MAEFGIAVRVTCFENCAPFSPCSVAWFRLDWSVEGGGSLAKSVGVTVFVGDLLSVRGCYVGEEIFLEIVGVR